MPPNQEWDLFNPQVLYGSTAFKRRLFTCSGKVQLNVTSFGTCMGLTLMLLGLKTGTNDVKVTWRPPPPSEIFSYLLVLRTALPDDTFSFGSVEGTAMH